MDGRIGSAERCVERAPRLEPAVGRGDVAFEHAREHGVERGAVIEVDQVRDFVRHHRAAHGIGRLTSRQLIRIVPPVEQTAPAALRARQPQLRRRDPGAARNSRRGPRRAAAAPRASSQRRSRRRDDSPAAAHAAAPPPSSSGLRGARARHVDRQRLAAISGSPPGSTALARGQRGELAARASRCARWRRPAPRRARPSAAGSRAPRCRRARAAASSAGRGRGGGSPPAARARRSRPRARSRGSRAQPVDHSGVIASSSATRPTMMLERARRRSR